MPGRVALGSLGANQTYGANPTRNANFGEDGVGTPCTVQFGLQYVF